MGRSHWTGNSTSISRIVVDGVELTVVLKIGHPVSISRVIGRDRQRGIDCTNGRTIDCAHTDMAAITFTLLDALRDVAALPTERCTCDYQYGHSDHAKHCRSIYVATCTGVSVDD